MTVRVREKSGTRKKIGTNGKKKEEKKTATTTTILTNLLEALPSGTGHPVWKWQSWRLRRRTGRWPNISGPGTTSGSGFLRSAESPMSISFTNQESRSCIGEFGCVWMKENRSVPLPKPYEVVRFSDRARCWAREPKLEVPAKVDWRPHTESFCGSEMSRALGSGPWEGRRKGLFERLF